MRNLFETRRLKDIALLSTAVLVIQIALSKWVYPLLGATIQNLLTVDSPSTSIGDKILGILSGVVSIDIGNYTTWLSMFIGIFVLLFAGYWVYDQRFAWKGKNIYQRLWAILLYGTIVLYAVIAITKMGVISTIAMPLLIGLGVNYFVVSFIISQLAKKINFLRI